MSSAATDPRPVFRTAEQLRLNDRRLEHLASSGVVIPGARVLDVGAGVGDLDDFFLDRGCLVTVTDARKANIEVARTDLAVATEGTDALRRAKFGVLDLDKPPPLAPRGSFDLVLCFGVLHLLSKPAEAISWCAANAGAMLLVDVVVSTSPEESLSLIPASSLAPDGPLGVKEARMSRAWLLAHLKRHLPHVYSFRSQPLHEAYPASGKPEDLRSLRRARVMLVASRLPMHHETLREELANEAAVS